jgi:acetyl-CoA acyltransferase
MSERVAIITGVRTPFCRAGGVFRDIEADDLGAIAVAELMARMGFDPKEIDLLVFGNVLQPPNDSNIARIIAVKACLPIDLAAYTVNHNCASGMQAVTTAAEAISLGKASLAIAGGCESMSNFPVFFKRSMREFLVKLSKTKGAWSTFKHLLSFRPNMLAPQVMEISDPLCGMNMGQTAELVARDLHVTREEQDAFGLASQQRSRAAQKSGFFEGEIIPVPLPPKFNKVQLLDDGIRDNPTLEGLAKLKPAFDRYTGTVTAGTSSQITDGAVALLLASESKAKELGLKPLGYLRNFAYIGLDPARMGLGPVFATAKLLEKEKYKLSDFDLIEINEAFAAQVLACQKAFASPEFSKTHLHRDTPLGIIDPEKLNVNGGAISLGHPLGASGARLILTILRELKRRQKSLGLAALCVGGGQGGAVIVEAAS